MKHIYFFTTKDKGIGYIISKNNKAMQQLEELDCKFVEKIPVKTDDKEKNKKIAFNYINDLIESGEVEVKEETKEKLAHELDNL
jgi:hypothetical protein